VTRVGRARRGGATGTPGGQAVARNVEIKAAVQDLASVTATLATLATTAPVVLVLEDTFFHCPRGRLKLRKLSPESGQLIYYERPDDAGPKTSAYRLVTTTEPDRLREVLAAAYGIGGVVRKRRTLRLVGRTRVHLDEVEGLGTFLELEVVLRQAEPAQAGVAEAERLMVALGIERDQLVCGAYVDLLRTPGQRDERPRRTIQGGPADPVQQGDDDA
jgi:predicted adenylyl cyclase CyaB